MTVAASFMLRGAGVSALSISASFDCANAPAPASASTLSVIAANRFIAPPLAGLKACATRDRVRRWNVSFGFAADYRSAPGGQRDVTVTDCIVGARAKEREQLVDDRRLVLRVAP